MSFHRDQMPPDPFADDPNDPASLLEPLDEPLDLSEEEIVHLREDLRNIRAFRRALEPRGIKGLEMLCEECTEPHCYEWSILEDNILAMLRRHPPAVHEPAMNPNPHAFVTWDYCAGYLDGIEFRLGINLF